MKILCQEKGKRCQNNYKSDLNEKSVLHDIEMLYKARNKVIICFSDYSSMASGAKCKTIYGKGPPLDLAFCLKILSPKQMLQRLPIALSKIKTANTTETC